MNTTIRHSAVVVLLMLYAACGDSGPTSPTRTTSQQAVPVPAPPAPPVTIPPLSGPSRTYVFDHELVYRVSDYTKNSRFVLYDSGAFALQYLDLSGEYRGAYTATDSDIVFHWEGWSVAGPWEATGTLTVDLLTVKYNLIMQMTDFEDAVYVLRP